MGPLIVAETLFQLFYFSGLRADVVTSCCGSLFSSTHGVAGLEYSGISFKKAVEIFYGGFLLMSGSGFTYLIKDRRIIKNHTGLEIVRKYADAMPVKNESQRLLNGLPCREARRMNDFQRPDKMGHFFSFTSEIFFSDLLLFTDFVHITVFL